MKEILQMSEKEIDRHHIIKQVLDRKINQAKAAELLGIKERQIRNLIVAFKTQGKKGLISKKRGKPSNRKYQLKFKSQVMALVREKYPDFGPTFAAEKLQEFHSIRLSSETLRNWMIEDRLWIPRRKRPRRHPPRCRREYFGELIQIDASIHPWFEDRGEKCALIVFIDDATSRVTALHFCRSESLGGYFKALEQHVLKYGRPRGLYSDRHSIFGGGDHMHQAQFKRVLKELDIESLLARSPQAKGRVERVNRTLQDRLIKEMRLKNINNMEDANDYLKEFIEKFNQKFSKEPRGLFDAHRPLESGMDLERILTRLEVRTVTKDLCISFNSKYYKIMEPSISDRIRKQKIEVRQTLDGSFKLFFNNKELEYVMLDEYESGQLMDAKEKLIWNWSKRGPRAQKASHPWKMYKHLTWLRERQKIMERMYNEY